MARPNEKLSKGFTAGTGFTKIGQANAWAGLTTLSSGSATVTVSTTMVRSDCIVRMGSSVASVGLGANSGGAIVVNSIVDSVSFAFVRATAIANPWDEVVMWELVRTSQG